jgi:hypothetical protein
MTAGVPLLPTFGGFLDHHTLEDWLGRKLQVTWAGLVAEPLPQSFHAAVATLAHSPSGRDSYAIQAGGAGMWNQGWSAWLQQMLFMSGCGQAAEHPKMVERAIRKQGVSWLTDSRYWIE